MNWLDQTLAWWRGGDLLMPVMLAIAVVLYAILTERTLVLWGVRRAARVDELQAALRGGDGRRAAWAARYVGLSEAEELSRGFALIRALTVSLPLMGLLGTVTGMIDTFGQLSAGATGGRGGIIAQHASAGIGLALTATQYGMALAIPAVVWDWALTRRVGQLVTHRELVVRQAQGGA